MHYRLNCLLALVETLFQRYVSVKVKRRVVEHLLRYVFGR